MSSRYEKVASPSTAFLGVTPEPVKLALRQRGVLGARVVEVFPSTPADRAGLRTGDLITRIDNQRVLDDDDLIRLVSARPPQTKVVLSVVRSHQVTSDPSMNRRHETAVEVLLSKKHVGTRRAPLAQHGARLWRGIEVDYVTAAANFKELVDRIDEDGCVLIKHVEMDSAGWNAGLRSGDLVSHAGGERVSNPDEFHAILARLEAEVELTTISRQGSVELRTVSP